MQKYQLEALTFPLSARLKAGPVVVQGVWELYKASNTRRAGRKTSKPRLAIGGCNALALLPQAPITLTMWRWRAW